ncbi:3-oxoacyl-ACP reductase FabG [Actinomadura viridis]|uniref:3-oxoacyl-[acyl-carrier protein] reductase n=1 Tax=Actinomadura viridis TaxID=58110 RepID=A0A931DNJ0_9ACTN|nr:SDR family oxidoreductase [Actinomadura viridis]MBG6092872.1 3-oxoacyl-[acyl-carrier protein] reductase [Actinomadura viridis]
MSGGTASGGTANGTRKALVTGASGGIGAATARLLARRGVDVWITYAGDQEGARRTAASCAAHGVRTAVSRLDLRSTEDIARLAARVRAEWGELHILVNNAGTCPYTAWPDIGPDEWDAVMDTNARGAFFLTKEAIALLRAARGDRAIVNVASLAGQVGGISTSVHYAASKAAVLAMTRSFARLLAAEGIRVNAVAPGPIRTPMTGGLDPGARDGLAAAVPLGRLGLPGEVAHAVCLLASPDAAFTTGATYDVNGGLRTG